jgi:ubiquinol-cytochrome c reductase cytochrome c1 subunit
MRARFLAATLAASLCGPALLALPAAPALAADDAALSPPGQSWGFSGAFGRIDKQAARRGFQVFSETCGACHSLAYVHYRDLTEIGFSGDEVKAIAAKVMVPAGTDAAGRPVMKKATPAAAFHAPFPSEDAARAAFNGALPPDLSLAVNTFADGPDYIYALLTGYRDPPKDFALRDGMNYNPYFPGRQIAMPPPLADNAAQNARDVVTFLEWAANPETNERKSIGVKAVVYFLGMAGIAYGFQTRIWAKVK